MSTPTVKPLTIKLFNDRTADAEALGRSYRIRPVGRIYCEAFVFSTDGYERFAERIRYDEAVAVVQSSHRDHVLSWLE